MSQYVESCVLQTAELDMSDVLLENVIGTPLKVRIPTCELWANPSSSLHWEQAQTHSQTIAYFDSETPTLTGMYHWSPSQTTTAPGLSDHFKTVRLNRWPNQCHVVLKISHIR